MDNIIKLTYSEVEWKNFFKFVKYFHVINFMQVNYYHSPFSFLFHFLMDKTLYFSSFNHGHKFCGLLMFPESFNHRPWLFKHTYLAQCLSLVCCFCYPLECKCRWQNVAIDEGSSVRSGPNNRKPPASKVIVHVVSVYGNEDSCNITIYYYFMDEKFISHRSLL